MKNSEWFSQLKKCLKDFYPPENPNNIVGYLRGTNSTATWSTMARTRSAQSIILGNVKPTEAEWQAAGVGERTGEEKKITIDQLNGFIILYDGFMVSRPWGKIFPIDDECVNIGFPGSIKSWGRAVESWKGKK
ncbi:MAG: hypothetical protein R2750_14020 [Bacteroidales bacterium]